MKVRRVAQRVADFEGGGFLPLDADWVDAVDDLNFAKGAKLAHYAQGFVEVAFHGHSGRPVHERLREFAEGNLAVGKQDDALHLRPGGIGRGRRRSVAGAGAEHHFGAALFGFGDGQRHPAVLERASRVQRLELEVKLELAADGFDKVRRADERRVAFIQGDDRRRATDRQVGRIAVDNALPGRLRTAGQGRRIHRGFKPCVSGVTQPAGRLGGTRLAWPPPVAQAFGPTGSRELTGPGFGSLRRGVIQNSPRESWPAFLSRRRAGRFSPRPVSSRRWSRRESSGSGARFPLRGLWAE